MDAGELSSTASITTTASIVRVDYRPHAFEALPANTMTAAALVQKHEAAGRGAALARARQRLASRMGTALPETLQEARLQAGLSQAGLAERLGTTQPRIARLEAGREDNPGLKTLRGLADALGLDLNAVARLFEHG